jgi:hypothetical protein
MQQLRFEDLKTHSMDVFEKQKDIPNAFCQHQCEEKQIRDVANQNSDILRQSDVILSLRGDPEQKNGQDAKQSKDTKLDIQHRSPHLDEECGASCCGRYKGLVWAVLSALFMTSYTTLIKLLREMDTIQVQNSTTCMPYLFKFI